MTNLDDALRLVKNWETKLRDKQFYAEYSKQMEKKVIMGEKSLKRGRKYIPEFHYEVGKFFMESKALMYPQLLPHCPLRSELTNSQARTVYTSSEIGYNNKSDILLVSLIGSVRHDLFG